MDICYECHGVLKDVGEYHPFLYCELVKLGHHDPAAYLASYGFVRESERRPPMRDAVDVGPWEAT